MRNRAPISKSKNNRKVRFTESRQVSIIAVQKAVEVNCPYPSPRAACTI